MSNKLVHGYAWVTHPDVFGLDVAEVTNPGHPFAFGPGGVSTPAEVVGKLNAEINSLLGEPRVKARLAELGATPLPGSPADFGRLIEEETEKWGKVVKFSGAKPE